MYAPRLPCMVVPTLSPSLGTQPPPVTDLKESKHEGLKVTTGSGEEDQASVHADQVGKKTSCRSQHPSAPEEVGSLSSKMSVKGESVQ